MTSASTAGEPLPALIARTVSLPAAQAGRLLSLLPPPDSGDVVSWVRRGEGLVGWGSVASVRTTGADRFRIAQQWWEDLVRDAIVRDEVSLPGTGPVAFGSFTFSSGSAQESMLVVPEVIVGRRGRSAWVTTLAVEATVPPADVAPTPADPPLAPLGVVFEDGSLTAGRFAGAVEEAVARITAGALDKVVLAREVEASASAPIDPRWLLQRLAEDYDSTWVFAVDGLVGATPELLVRLERGLVTSRVLAGTIQRTGDDSRDLALAGSLARSSKDREEHEYAVRSVVEALGEHTSSINVPDSPFVLHLNNVMHLATDVAGVAADGSSSLALAAALHPSAAVCGTPTITAAQVIAELEEVDRGRYAGPVGWIDAHGDGEWGIALRCGHITAPDRVRLYAGCGIVAGSVAADEVAESEAKLLPMKGALGA